MWAANGCFYCYFSLISVYNSATLLSIFFQLKNPQMRNLFTMSSLEKFSYVKWERQQFIGGITVQLMQYTLTDSWLLHNEDGCKKSHFLFINNLLKISFSLGRKVKGINVYNHLSFSIFKFQKWIFKWLRDLIYLGV